MFHDSFAGGANTRRRCVAVPRSSLSGERAAAFLEFIISVPFLLIMFMGIADLGVTLNRYYIISRVAYEGVRFAASMPALEQASFSTRVAAASPPAANAHLRVRDRVDLLLAKNGVNPAGLQPSYLTTSRVAAASGPGWMRDQVVVRIEIPPLTLFSFIGNIIPSITAQESGPYLYR